MPPRIVVLAGDGIGPEIVTATCRVMEAALRRANAAVELVHRPIGLVALEQQGRTIPAETQETLEAADGVLLYETFATGNAAYGKPSNPDFLLEPAELLGLAREKLTVVAFEQGLREGPAPAVIQRLAAVGHARAWPPALPEWGLG